MKPFFVYMLRCSDGSYYTGQTDDIGARMRQHEAGEIGYTSERKPVELVWQGEFESREDAIGFEQRIKGWSRAKKEALMAGDWERVQALARTKTTVRTEQSTVGTSQTSVRTEQPSVRTEQPSVRTEPVEVPRARAGLRQAQPERGEAQPDGGQAQPERGPAQPERPNTSAPDALLDGILNPEAGPAQRRAIAKAITLLESTRADHRGQADALLTALLPHTGKSLRLGISGVPGVGKSTFIEVLGLMLIGLGHRVAVLTIDPSSTVSGGSILGDKTRMEKLSVHEMAYIRPSPSSGTLGGVAEKTREAMLVCEAAGYDIVIVETVGVGQSETAVSGMTDMFVLMQLPNAGDDLQAIKKGVMELADLVVINKADLDADAATRAQAQITSALRLFTQHGRGPHPSPLPAGEGAIDWHPAVIQLSALLGEGVDRFWDEVNKFKASQTASGRLAARRQHQALAWMWERIDAGLKHAFKEDPRVRAMLPGMLQQVERGELPSSTAARQLLDAAANSTVRAEPVEARAQIVSGPSTASTSSGQASSGRTDSSASQKNARHPRTT